MRGYKYFLPIIQKETLFLSLFVFLEWSRGSSLYILETKLLSEISLANIFSRTAGSLFILLMFSLAMQKLFNLIRSHLFILSFMFIALRDILLKILLHGVHEIFLPMLSSRIFMVSRLIFKSFIHLGFILMYGISWYLSFIFFAFICPDVPTPFAEEAIFTPFYASVHFGKY